MEPMAQGFEQYDEQLAQLRLEHVERELSVANVTADTLNEAYSDAVRQMFAAEDIGWQRVGGADVNGVNNLGDVKMISSKLSDWAVSNPLLKRGLEINCSYQLSDSYEIGTRDAKSKITAQQMNNFLRRENQDSVFSLAALSSIIGQWFEAGNAFVEFEVSSKTFQQIPLGQVADVIFDPMDANRIRYVKRSASVEVIMPDGSRQTKLIERWVPAADYKLDSGERYPEVINQVAVDTNRRVVVSRVNRKVGSVFGVPDAFAAAPWALAYSAYLRDGTKVLAALAEWVWKITPKKKNAAERAAATVRKNGPGSAGGSLFTDMDVQSLPKSDAIDLNTGRPLAAQAAAALGVSVVLLLADPGQSGAYGTAQTLSDPNRRTMQARREVLTAFLIDCLELLGIKQPAIVWTKMAPGTDKEEMDLHAQAWGTGLFDPEEIRPAMARIAKLELLSDAAPDGVIIPNNERWQKETSVDPDGVNSQTNGVGRDNLNQGPVSRDDSSTNADGPNE